MQSSHLNPSKHKHHERHQKRHVKRERETERNRKTVREINETERGRGRETERKR